MLFNSFEFILLFLPITFAVYFFLNHNKLIELAKGWLVLASLVFYSYWNIKYLPLILCSMIFNYSIGTTLNSENNLKINRKAVLIFGITANLLLLGYYKYYDFFLSNLNAFGMHLKLLQIILPLGISFFTFTQIAYLVDAYKKEVREADFLNYALFVTYFPHLIAGPILHHSEMMPQFAKLKNKIINHKNISLGILLFTAGLLKKVIIADNLSPIVVQGFDTASHLTILEAWITSFAYTFQLYCDFSGYTDMALGLSWMFNIKLPENFNSPYRAQNIQDFWRRWHMTLSRFLKNYVYIPLGGNKNGEFNTYKNLFLTFLIGGLWHGAAWTFIMWGALHGFALVFHRFWKKLDIKMHSFIAWFVTFNFVNITWIFFRAKTFNDALKLLKGMFGFEGFAVPKIYHGLIRIESISGIKWEDYTFAIILIIILLLGTVVLSKAKQVQEYFKPNYAWCVVLGIIFAFAFVQMNNASEFLYFNF